MSNSENDGSKGCLIFAAAIFGLAALTTALGFVFGGKSFLSDFLSQYESFMLKRQIFNFIIYLLIIFTL